MQASRPTEQEVLADYEGLVRATASRYVPLMAGAAMDFDDICQVLRVAIWKAIEAYDPARAKQPMEKWVFMCLRNRAKDLGKRRHPEHDALFIEDVAPTQGNGTGEQRSARDAFELAYRSVGEEQVLASVLEEPPVIPNTLTHNERSVLVLLYNEYRQAEIAPKLGLTPSQVKTAVKGIRAKMADWCPSETPTQVVASAA